jgi:cation diffusion facilitator family transporter
MLAEELGAAGCHSVETAAASEREEARLRWVVVVTLAAMLGELVVGLASGSLALVAEGWHMACHAGALGLAALAYWFARTRARDAAFAFGTGKVHALAGYTNAIILLLVSIFTIVEGARRLFTPVRIDFREALPAALAGLVVNLVCVRLLDVHEHVHEADHDHEHDDDHAHDDHAHDDRNHNLRAAYLHVLADLVTSVAAVLALAGARWGGWRSLDPVMAVLSSVVVLRWGVGLVRTSGSQLLDATSSARRAGAIRAAIAARGGRVVDLHLWQLGPGRQGCVLAVAYSGACTLEELRTAVRGVGAIDHLTIEIRPN